MKPLEFLLVITGVMLNAAAQLLLKAGTRSIGTFEFRLDNLRPIGWALATSPPVIGGLSCYVISVVVWIMALSRVEVSLAYPLLSLGYVVNAVLAWWLFGESLNPTRIAGIAIILVGVYVLTRSGSVAR